MTPAHAIVAMTRTYERFMCGDMDAARDQSELAIELGERTGVIPAVVIGRTARARVRIFDGDLDGDPFLGACPRMLRRASLLMRSI